MSDARDWFGWGTNFLTHWTKIPYMRKKLSGPQRLRLRLLEFLSGKARSDSIWRQKTRNL